MTWPTKAAKCLVSPVSAMITGSLSDFNSTILPMNGISPKQSCVLADILGFDDLEFWPVVCTGVSLRGHRHR